MRAVLHIHDPKNVVDRFMIANLITAPYEPVTLHIFRGDFAGYEIVHITDDTTAPESHYTQECGCP